MRHLFVAATLAAALPFAGLPSEFEKIAPAAKGRVGIAAQLLESRETASFHGDEGFRWGLIFTLHTGTIPRWGSRAARIKCQK